MKTTAILPALLALPLCGCAQETASTDPATMNTTGKALVAYFSATGTTKGVAERLAGAIGADHTDLYDGGGKNAIPFDRIEAFYRKNLK